MRLKVLGVNRRLILIGFYEGTRMNEGPKIRYMASITIIESECGTWGTWANNTGELTKSIIQSPKADIDIENRTT